MKTRKATTYRLEPDVAELLKQRQGDYASMSENAVVNIAVRRLLKAPPADSEVVQIARRIAERDHSILEALKNL